MKTTVEKQEKDDKGVQWYRVTDPTPGKHSSVSIGVRPKGGMIYPTGKLVHWESLEARALRKHLTSGL